MNVWLIRLSMAATLDGGGGARFSESALYPAGRVHAIAQQAGTRKAAPSALKRARYADGGSPTIAREVRLNVPRLLNPTSKQISVTGRSVSRSNSIARSTRRRCR